MSNPPENTVTFTLDQQLSTLGAMADKLAKKIQQVPDEATQEASQQLAHLSASLSRFSKQISEEADEKKNLQALANMGQVINSSLNPDEVLRIVMDTIVRLTGAERGFLMLKGKDGQLDIRLARNWEQESLEASEFKISQTIVNRKP